MINHGIVFLYDRAGDLVVAKNYASRKIRKEITEYWERIYSDAYKKCFIQIQPFADPLLVNEDGTNKSAKEVSGTV